MDIQPSRKDQCEGEATKDDVHERGELIASQQRVSYLEFGKGDLAYAAPRPENKPKIGTRKVHVRNRAWCCEYCDMTPRGVKRSASQRERCDRRVVP